MALRANDTAPSDLTVENSPAEGVIRIVTKPVLLAWSVKRSVSHFVRLTFEARCISI